MGKNVWVGPHKHGWAAKTEGTDKAAGVFKTQAEAIDRGRDMAEARRSELIIQGRDGQIRAKDSQGNDPRRTKG
jgi:hypothetical protein